jgi:pimeloyl-ACP methyl ester carboxylesterase
VDGPALAQTPFYLRLDAHQVFAFYHEPAENSASDIGVLMCPPFGWEEVCSYRSRRAWAEDLAGRGYGVLRIDFPGSGDSAGSPRDPGRVQAWSDSIAVAAAWLRAQTGASRIVAIGVGLGGMMAVQALSQGATVDDLVLWAVPSRGRALVRELDVFARLEVEWSGETPPPDEAGGLTAGGFAMSDETLGALRALNLTDLELPPAAQRRVLLLERDGLAPDARLRAHLEAAGAAVEIAPGDGYGRMMDDPRWAQSPRSVFATTAAWLAAAPPSQLASAPPTEDQPTANQTMELASEGRRIRETPLWIDAGGPSLFGILAEPVDQPRSPVCAVLLNAGPVRRIGPNRMWVEASRRWAADGVATLRVDMHALGDSEGDEVRYTSDNAYYVPDLTEYTLKLLSELERRGLPGSFFLAGLCSGAYWSFRAALRDPRVRGGLLINLWSFFWTRSLYLDREFRRARVLIRKRQHLRWAGVMLALGILRLPGLAFRAARRRRRIELALKQLAALGTQLSFVFSTSEPLLAELSVRELWSRLATIPGMTLERLPTGDHTLRAPAYQRHLHGALDAALARTLTRVAAQEDGRAT